MRRRRGTRCCRRSSPPSGRGCRARRMSSGGVRTDERVEPSIPRGRLGRAISRVVSDGSLTKKASLNAAASTAEQIARIVAGLLITPFLVSRLGAEVFGIWQVLQRLIGHASPASGRPGEALKWTIAHEQRSDDFEFKRRAVGNAVAVWLLFLPVLVAVGGAFAWLSPIWLHVPAEDFGIVRLAAGILVLDAVLFSLLYLPQSVLQGENLGYKRLGLSVLLVFISKGMLLLAVYLGFGITGLAVATAAGTVLWGLVYVQIVRSRVSWFGIARPSLSEVRKFVGLSWWFLLWNLVMTVMLAADVVVLGIVASTTLLTWEGSFLRLWVGAQYDPGTAALLTVMLMVMQFALIRTDANIIDLTLNLRRKVLIGAVSAATSIVLAWLFLGPMDMGIIGLVLGFVVGRAIQSISYPLMVGRLLGIAPAEQLRGVVRPALVTALLFVGGSLLGSTWDTRSWPMLLLASGATALAVAALAFFAGMSEGARSVLWRRLAKVA